MSSEIKTTTRYPLSNDENMLGLSTSSNKNRKSQHKAFLLERQTQGKTLISLGDDLD